MSLVSAVKHVLRRLGVDLIHYDVSHAGPLRRMRLLQDQRISMVLDVGANSGIYASRLRTAGFKGRIVSFEPLSQAYAELERRAAADSAWETHHLALGSQSGNARLNVAGNSFSSSLLPMTKRHVAYAPTSAYVGTEEVPVRSLDALSAPWIQRGERLHLKIDTQGFEQEVLSGATETLRHVYSLETELSLVPLYEGQPKLAEILIFLDAAGFDLMSMEAEFTDPVTGRMLQVNGMFARRETQAEEIA